MLATAGAVREARAAIPERVIRLALSGTMSSGSGMAASTMASVIDKLSQGRIRVDLYPASAAGSDPEMAEGLALGSVDLLILSATLLLPYGTDVGVFDMMYLFRDVAHARAVLDGPLGREALGWFAAKGIQGLAWGEIGFRHITANKPVRRPDDLKGMKLRVPVSDVELAGFRSLGVNAIQTPFNNLYGALADGRVDGQENPLGVIESSRFNEVQTTLSLTGHIYSPYLLGASAHLMSALSPGDRDIIEEAARQAALVSRKVAEDFEKAGRERLRQAGMVIVEDIDKAAFVSALTGFTASMTERYGRERIAAIRATA